MKKGIVLTLATMATTLSLEASSLSLELRSKTIGHCYPLVKGVPERVQEGGEVVPLLYASYLVDIHHVIEFLEQRMRIGDDPRMAPLSEECRDRTSAVMRDIYYFRTQLGKVAPDPTSEAQNYRYYLESLRDEPYRYIGHIWVFYQYLATSGWRCGTTVGTNLELGLEALNTYGYGGQLRQRRYGLRHCLDRLQLESEEIREIVAVEVPAALDYLDGILQSKIAETCIEDADRTR